MLDIHITTTTQVIIALLCYVTIYAVAVFLVSTLKWKIQSKCCFAILAVLGSLLILAAGFTGLAFQIKSEASSTCQLYHQRYTDAVSYITCQVHRIDNHLHNTTTHNVRVKMTHNNAPLQNKLDAYFQHLQRQKPRQCPERTANVLLNDCNVLTSSHNTWNSTEFDMRKFVELHELPLCGSRDLVVTCQEKRNRLVEKLNEALTVEEEQ